MDFANFTFPPDACGETFLKPPSGGYRLRNGEATHGTPADADFYSLSLRSEISYGDLNGDGNDEAALILDCVAGNRPEPVAWVYTISGNGPTALGRITLSSTDSKSVASVRGTLLGVKIAANKLVTTWALYNQGDPICCPSKQATITQHWTGATFETEGTPTVG